MSNEQKATNLGEFLVNSLLSRSAFNAQLFDGRYGTRDIDAECGYPEGITTYEYVKMYERHDIAARVVDIEPNECWKEYPDIYETEEERETKFEKAVDKLINETNLYTYLARVDRISGIGRYGILFLGFDDGNDFYEPAPGFDESGPLENKPGKAEILYYRVVDESGVSISEFEEDKTNKRYGLPKYYTITFQQYIVDSPNGNAVPSTESMKVHWSRVIHVADNLTVSEIFGTPRMQNVFNRLYDLRKINGGAGEMFWKGGFPGYSFEVDPKNGEFTETEKDNLREETRLYSEGLVRYLTTVGVSVKSLSPQVANPEPHVTNALRIISITKGIPQRLFMGSEQGSLASTQDSGTWAERVALRRNMYVTPYIIRTTIDRLIQAGALPKPKEGYSVKWRPLATLTEPERAQVGRELTEALARYATSGGEALIPLPEFLGKFLKFSYQEVEAIGNAPKTELSVVLQEMAKGMTGAAGGNVPSSIPDMPKPGDTKDPSKTPPNMVQKPKGSKMVPIAKQDQTPENPPAVQG